MPQSIPKGLCREHVLKALADLEAGIDHSFGRATGYELVYKGKRYAPKAVIGIAFRHLTGEILHHSDFSGGEAPGQANYELRLTEGHTLVVPKQHVASIYELSPNDHAALWRLVAEARRQLNDDLHPDGFNIGVNDGPAAGQTVMHAHIHIIPRRNGDVADPRGGVRTVLPKKARYW